MAAPSKAIESYKSLLATTASMVASAMLVRGVVNDLLPYELQDYVSSQIDSLRGRLRPVLHTIIVHRKEGYSSNLIHDAVKVYLSTRIDCRVQRLRASKVEGEQAIAVSLDYGEEMVDVYKGVEFRWKLACKNKKKDDDSKKRDFEVSFDQKHAEMALHEYLPFIVNQAEIAMHANRTLKLYMNNGIGWESINLHHPSTFDTLAMDEELKQVVMDDLARFVKRRDYYRRIGKAWKRGYLLHGPPGTGKSSLVAAMANYLKFDIYDMELSQVRSNSTLRSLVVSMSNRSILLVEDIDCAIDLQSRENRESSDGSSADKDNAGSSPEHFSSQITLSGLLNFVDGLWSASGEERIIVFTTNYKDRLDPALLRPGRMDMHVHMGFCTPYAFRTLASNYHSVDHHELFPEIERLVRDVQVTPAEIAGELMKNDDAGAALQGLVEFLQKKE